MSRSGSSRRDAVGEAEEARPEVIAAGAAVVEEVVRLHRLEQSMSGRPRVAGGAGDIREAAGLTRLDEVEDRDRPGRARPRRCRRPGSLGGVVLCSCLIYWYHVPLYGTTPRAGSHRPRGAIRCQRRRSPRRSGNATSSIAPRASRTSSTWTSTWCTRSPAPRRSRDCACTVARFAAPTSRSRRWITTCRRRRGPSPMRSRSDRWTRCRRTPPSSASRCSRWARPARASCT